MTEAAPRWAARAATAAKTAGARSSSLTPFRSRSARRGNAQKTFAQRTFLGPGRMALRPGLLHVMARWRQGKCGTAKDGTNPHARCRVTSAGPHTRSRHQRQTGQAGGAPASHQHRYPADELLRSEEDGSAGSWFPFLRVPGTPRPARCFFVIALGLLHA
jgi:hypothetical protein